MAISIIIEERITKLKWEIIIRTVRIICVQHVRTGDGFLEKEG